MATLHDRLARARERLVSAGIAPEEATLDADVLARHVLGWDRVRLLTHAREPAPEGFDDAFEPVVARRAGREPISQIVGYREFWGLEFEVTPDVLTPRPETELIVEEALKEFSAWAPGLIVDVGTGSGCLAVALAREFPRANLVATDISMPALNVARRNAIRHGVNRRIAFVETDLFAKAGQIDLIVANPPYVPERDLASLAAEVRDHEPEVALFGGADGLAIYRRLLPEARALIEDPEVSPSRLIVEVGYDQAAVVTELAAAWGWQLVRARKDLQGIPRTLVFRIEGTRGE
jgi:release factor glutamine methyltransferase